MDVGIKFPAYCLIAKIKLGISFTFEISTLIGPDFLGAEEHATNSAKGIAIPALSISLRFLFTKLPSLINLSLFDLIY